MKKHIENSVLLRLIGQWHRTAWVWGAPVDTSSSLRSSHLPLCLLGSPLSTRHLHSPTAGLGSPSPSFTLIGNLILAVLCLYPLWKLSPSSVSRTTALIQVFVTSDGVATEVNLSPCLQLCSTPGHSPNDTSDTRWRCLSHTHTRTHTHTHTYN